MKLERRSVEPSMPLVNGAINSFAHLVTWHAPDFAAALASCQAKDGTLSGFFILSDLKGGNSHSAQKTQGQERER
jgi:hypothetical protein